MRLAFAMMEGPCRRFSGFVPYALAASWAADWTADGRPSVAFRLPRRATRSQEVRRLMGDGWYPATLAPAVARSLGGQL